MSLRGELPIIQPWAFDDFVFRDEAGVRDGVFFVDDFDGFEKALQAGPLDFGIARRVRFGEKNERGVR